MVQPSERLERAKEQARRYHSLQSIPDDIQSCLLTMVQHGWSPDQVRSSYCLVREHFGASGTQTSHVPMDTHIELPTGPPEFPSPSSLSVGESGPATTYATSSSLFESIYGPDQASINPGCEPTLHNAVHDTGRQFASPVSAAAALTASRQGSGHEFAMATPTSSSQQYPGSFSFADSPQIGNTLAFTGAGLNIQPSGPLYGLGLTQSPGLMPSYVLGPGGAAIPPVVPGSDMMTAPSTLSTWSEASPSFKPSTDLHSPPFTPNSSEQPNKRQRKLRKEVKRITKPLQPPRPPRRATHPPRLSDAPQQAHAQPRSVMALASPRPPMPGTPFPTSSPYLPTSYWTPMPSPPHVLQSSPGGAARRGSVSDPAAPRPRAISSPLHRFPSTVYDGSYPPAESELPFPVTSA